MPKNVGAVTGWKQVSVHQGPREQNGQNDCVVRRDLLDWIIRYSLGSQQYLLHIRGSGRELGSHRVQRLDVSI